MARAPRGEKVRLVGVRREEGFLYFITPEGNVARVAMVKTKAGLGVELVAETSIAREPGYIYFVDAEGDVARVDPTRRGAAKEKLATVKGKKKAPQKSAKKTASKKTAKKKKASKKKARKR